MTEENCSHPHRYQYDSLYNRVEKDGIKNKINSLNQLEEDASCQYQYDANGRLTEKIGTQPEYYQYDAWDRLTAYTKNNQRWLYRYDSEHRRLSKTYQVKDKEEWLTKEVTQFIYQGLNEVGACDETGEIFQLRILGLGKGAEIGAEIAIELDQNVFAPIHDHNGNVILLIDSSSGEIAAKYDYSAFGEEHSENDLKNPWRFSSKRVDEETELVYFGRRYYDPFNGRWTTPDPIGLEDGPNLYAYVKNSPLINIDLWGLLAEHAISYPPDYASPQGIFSKGIYYA